MYAVLSRSRGAGVEKIIVTAGCLSDVNDALQLCEQYPDLYTTVGVHPTRCGELDADPKGYLAELSSIANRNRDKVVCSG